MKNPNKTDMEYIGRVSRGLRLMLNLETDAEFLARVGRAIESSKEEQGTLVRSLPWSDVQRLLELASAQK